MIAYKEKSLDQMVINDEAAFARHRQFISADEYAAIVNAHKPELYSPNIFIRIGLFVLTVVIVLMSFGLLFLIMGSPYSNDATLFTITLIFGLSIYAALEWIVQTKRHYRSGVDDALLWLSLLCIVTDIGLYFNLSSLQTSLLIFILSFAATIRFANSVMSAVAFCSFICFIFYAISPAGPIARSILPFTVMLLSLAIYYLIRRRKHRPSLRHYKYCFVMLEVLSLAAIYASMNYFVVRELSIHMFHFPQSATIVGGLFFWICTFLLPLLYIMRGLQSKDHLILRVGLVSAAATVFTFRYYYSLTPVEQLMTAGGIMLIIVAYTFIRYLQTPKRGITDRPSDLDSPDGGLHVESLVIAETFNETTTPDDGFRFGGGTTGGGGATGQF